MKNKNLPKTIEETAHHIISKLYKGDKNTENDSKIFDRLVLKIKKLAELQADPFFKETEEKFKGYEKYWNKKFEKLEKKIDEQIEELQLIKFERTLENEK